MICGAPTIVKNLMNVWKRPKLGLRLRAVNKRNTITCLKLGVPYVDVDEPRSKIVVGVEGRSKLKLMVTTDQKKKPTGGSAGQPFSRMVVQAM